MIYGIAPKEDCPFAIGDQVYVEPKKVQAMDGYWVEDYQSGKTGIIEDFGVKYDWEAKYGAKEALVFFPVDDSETYLTGTAFDTDISRLRLVRKGDGRAVMGIHYPIPARVWREKLYHDYLHKLRALDQSHQGFSNAATFLAWLYLNNDRAAVQELHRLRRKDGTINPSKVAKVAFRRNVVVDDWALQLPIDPPTEVAGWIPHWAKPRVNWDEVAEMFQADKYEVTA